MEYRVTSGVHTLAQSSAGPDGQRHLVGAHRHVHRAEEQMQLRGAPVLYQWTEGLQRHVGVRLQGMPRQVGHAGLVVSNVLTHRHFNRFTCPHGGLGGGSGH